jgi:hypothetical protein
MPLGTEEVVVKREEGLVMQVYEREKKGLS